MAHRKLSQTALAEHLGVDRAMVSRYITEDRKPGDMICLVLAALSATKEESQFWVSQSGLADTQLKLIAKALSAPEPSILSGEEQDLLNWWRNTANPVEASIKDVVEKLLALRTKRV